MKYLPKYSLLLAAPLLLLSAFSRAAYVSAWRGAVDIKKAGSSWARMEGESKAALGAGDFLRTARASTVEIVMNDGSRVKVAPLSSFQMTAENGEAVSVGLHFGRVRSWVKKFSKKFEVRTPSAVCAVRGTDFTVAANADGDTTVEVYEGSVLAGDKSGGSALIKEGQTNTIPMNGRMGQPRENSNPPDNMDGSSGDARVQARRELYSEISKADVLAEAQAEIQSAEFQNRKVAIDAFGNRVRMEEYVVRPAADQFKYVVLNTRADRFDFGKILFTFNSALPGDLSLATKNMIYSAGSERPQWELTDINSIMSNTSDKVTEDATGGRMVADNGAAPAEWSLVFAGYSFYVKGGDQAADPVYGDMGSRLWSLTSLNMHTGNYASASYLGGAAPSATSSNPSGADVYHSVAKNIYTGGVWIQAEDFVLFDSGKILAAGDFANTLGMGMDMVTDHMNFERVYTSSLFNGRKIDLEYSAKLLKDAGLLRF